MFNGSSSGGIISVINCKTGWHVFNGGTNINHYASSGGQEYLNYGNEGVGGDLLLSGVNYTGSVGNSGTQCYSHTGSGTVAWGITWRNFVRALVRCGYSNNNGSGNAPPWSDIAIAKVYFIEDGYAVRTPAPTDTTTAFWSTSPGTNTSLVTINSPRVWRVLSNPVSTQIIAGDYSSVAGPNAYLNCDFLYDYTANQPGTNNFKNGIVTGNGLLTVGSQWYNCRIVNRVSVAGSCPIYSLFAYLAPTATTWCNTAAIMQNCILVGDGANGSSFSLGINNQAGQAQIANNVYVGFDPTHKTNIADGWSTDPGLIELTNLPAGPPVPGSAIVSANFSTLPGGHTLQYDATWAPRSTATPARGPLEPIRTASTGLPAQYTTGSASGGSATNYSTGSSAA